MHNIENIFDLSEQQINNILIQSTKHHKFNWDNRFELTSSNLLNLKEKVENAAMAMEPVLRTFPDVKFVSLDYNKTCCTKDYSPTKNNWGYNTVESVLKEFWKAAKVGNLGIVGGTYKDKNLVVIDIDNNVNKRNITVQQVVELIGVKTFIVETPSGGKHLYFWTNEKIGCPKTWSSVAIDIKSEKGYVVAVGSRTKKGYYAWDVENEFFQQDISQLPTDWKDKLNKINPSLSTKPIATKTYNKTQEKSCMSSLSAKSIIPVGERNSYMLRMAGSLINKHTDIESFTNAVFQLKNNLESPESFSDKEVQNIVNCVFKKENSKKDSAYKSTSHIQGSVSSKLQELISKTEKTVEFAVKLSDVATVIKNFFNANNIKIEKAIKASVVGKFLTTAGFSKKLKTAKRVAYWNINLSQLQDLINLELNLSVKIINIEWNKKAPAGLPNKSINTIPVSKPQALNKPLYSIQKISYNQGKKHEKSN